MKDAIMEEALMQEEQTKELSNTESLQEQEKPPENKLSAEVQETRGQLMQSENSKRNNPPTNQQDSNNTESTRDTESKMSSHNTSTATGSIQDNLIRGVE